VAASDDLLHIDLLGGFRVRMGQRLLLDQSWGRRKARALVKVVSLQPDRGLHRDAVLEALWPDLGVRAATNNLHKNMHHLRTALVERGIEAPLLELRDDRLWLAPGVEVDVTAFRAAAAAARGSGEIARYEAALAIYRGDLLPEDVYEEWSIADREELRALFGRMLAEAAELDERAGRVNAAVDRLEQLLRLDPLDEDVHRRLMRLHAGAGSRHRALRQYERCRDALRRELDVEPSLETEALHHSIAEGEPRRPAGTDPGHADELHSVGAALAPPAGPPPIGRDRELGIAEEAIEAAIAGEGQVLFVRGEAGIGKSHLIEAIAGEAEAAGARVLRARAYRFDAAVPYQPVRELLQGLLDEVADPAVDELVERSSHLERLSGRRTAPAPPGETGLLRAELFDEVTRLFALLAEYQPLLIAFDDLHEADDATLQLLHYIARQLADRAVLLLAGYRVDEEHRPALDELRAALRRDGRLREIALDPLPDGAIRLLVDRIFGAGPVEPDLADEIAERAGGNPLFAHELVHTMIDEGRARFADGRWQRRASAAVPVPDAVQDLLARRLQRLSGAAQDQLNVAATSAREIDFGTLRHITGLSDREALDALDECLGAFILRESAAGYGFRHDLLREAVYSRLTAARRQHLHRLVAEAPLAGVGQRDDEEVAYHFAASDEPWRAVPYLASSARRAAAVFANEQALSLYHRALEIARECEAHLPPVDHAALLEEIGDLRRRLGDADAGVALFEQAAGLFEAAADDEAAARARGKAGLGHIIRGDVAAAAEHIEAARNALTDRSPDAVVSRTYYLLAQLHWHSGEHRDALGAAERALLAADAANDPGQRAGAYEVLALACHSLGDWQRGVRLELDRQALGVGGFDSDEAFDAHL
jgi:DNA-binding SARP family transcriptional activator/tetratricopeptide (TPR) repeat protein